MNINQMYLQAGSVTKSTGSIVTITSFFRQSWKKFIEIQFPNLCVHVNRISNGMQNLCKRQGQNMNPSEVY
jgi:hypothetical protein